MKASTQAGACPSRRRFLKVVAAHSAALLGVGGLAHMSAAARSCARLVHWRGIALGTAVSIELFSEDEAAARDALRACRGEIARLESIFSLYDVRSAVGRLNRDGRLTEPPAELVELLQLCATFSERTDGAFDITIQPLVELLQTTRGTAGAAAIAGALALVDWRAVRWDNESIHFAEPGMRVTFNGVAQGYITDRVAGLLRARGFDHTLVDLGEKRALGGHPDGRPWSIGIESPFETDALAGALELDNRALATSGGYGEVFAGGGRTHLLDARSGHSHHAFASISVSAPHAVIADALSTSLSVCDPASAPAILARFADAEAWVIGSDERVLRRLM